jgi:hypothetical protein
MTALRCTRAGWCHGRRHSRHGGAAAEPADPAGHADVFGAEVRRVEVGNAAALGAALRALQRRSSRRRRPDRVGRRSVTGLEQPPPRVIRPESRPPRDCTSRSGCATPSSSRRSMLGPAGRNGARTRETAATSRPLHRPARRRRDLASAQDATAVVADAARAMGVQRPEGAHLRRHRRLRQLRPEPHDLLRPRSTSIPNYIRTIDFELRLAGPGDTQPPQVRGPPPQPGTYLRHHAGRHRVGAAAADLDHAVGLLIGAASHRPTVRGQDGRRRPIPSRVVDA